MIKFRYKRKEPPANNGNGTTKTNSVKSSSNKSVEIKTIDGKDKDTAKHTPLKCETNVVVESKSTLPSTSSSSPSQLIKAQKTNNEQEYMEDCIRAIVVSVVRN